MTAPTPEERAENACEAGGIAPTGAACAAIAAEIRAAVEAERVLGAYARLAAANARLAAAPSRDVPCVTCGHSIMVHQNNEAGGPCGRCDCEDGALLVNPPKL